MSITKRLGFALIAVALAACAAPSNVDGPALVEIEPRDFVLLPCGVSYADRPCLLAVAGGKRILFGAPAGAITELREEDLRQLDAVIVLSLRAGDLEGLDEIRNESWRAGRDAPLLVIGPSGIELVSDALNKAFEQADALRIVAEGFPPGGYDAAVLVARPYSRDSIVFNTGDVVIEATGHGYRMAYNNQAVADLQACGTEIGEQEAGAEGVKLVSVVCATADGTHAWPVAEPIIIVDN